MTDLESRRLAEVQWHSAIRGQEPTIDLATPTRPFALTNQMESRGGLFGNPSTLKLAQRDSDISISKCSLTIALPRQLLLKTVAAGEEPLTSSKRSYIIVSMQPTISKTFTDFFDSEKSGGILLIVCTIASLALANSALGPAYLRFWQVVLFGLTVEHWINDALMALFFLLIGLELERELYVGELSNIKNALLPIIAAVGGIAAPTLIHFTLNSGTPTQAGASIPMATDIAFALGVLALLGSSIPTSLKVFLTALAVMDDLGAIIVIALFYTQQLSVVYLLSALLIFASLVLVNWKFRVMSLVPYLFGGALMWFFMLKSGVHATIAGVLLAFAIPFSAKVEDEASPSHRLEHLLHKPVAFIALPIFALANTGIVISTGWQHDLVSANGAGIIGGLVLGKPIGIVALSFIAVTVGICQLPTDVNWRHIFGAGLLGGIGFTMSIFITNLAFTSNAEIVNASKMAILLASLCAGVLGFLSLRFFSNASATDSIVR